MRILAFGEGADFWEATIMKKFDNVEVVTAKDLTAKVANLEEVNVLIGWRFPEELLRRLTKLLWIQLICVGADGWVKHPLVDPKGSHYQYQRAVCRFRG